MGVLPLEVVDSVVNSIIRIPTGRTCDEGLRPSITCAGHVPVTGTSVTKAVC